jgi:hypothetical protein
LRGWLAAIFVRNPATAMARVNHLPDALPSVMTGRYIANFALASGATLYGDLWVIAFLFAAFALMAYYDTAIYHRRGTRFAPHLAAGIGATLVVSVALAAILNGPA